MAKKIDRNSYVGKEFENTNGHKYIIQEYLGEMVDNKDYFLVKFLDTNSIYSVDMDRAVKRCTARDITRDEKDKKEKKSMDISKRKKVLNSKSNKTEEFGHYHIPDKNKEIILSIDQSSTCSGIAIVQDGCLVHSEAKKWKTGNISNRLVEQRKYIQGLIDTYHPTFIIFEDIYLDKNLNVYRVLAFVMGILIELATSNNIVYYIATKSEWSSGRLFTKGREKQKIESIKLANKLTKTISDDEADAVNLASYAYNNLLKDEISDWENNFG